MSTWMLPNLLSAAGKISTGAFTCLATFEAWHGWHVLHHPRTSFLTEGQTNLYVTNLIEGFGPGWLKECRASNTDLRKLAGTRGLANPVETSQKRLTPCHSTIFNSSEDPSASVGC